MRQLNEELVANGLKSAQVLLQDKGISPIKKLILVKNLATKLIPQRSLEHRHSLKEKLALLCDTNLVAVTEEEEIDLMAWVDENAEMNLHFSSTL
jgi:hypothetical protein